MNKNPAQNIETDEFNHAFLSFCTFVSLLNGKKMNFPTVFLKILDNKRIRDIYIEVIGEDNEFGAISRFIETEPSITKSKYVTKYLNKRKDPLL
jgi:hypothetical protein